MLVGEKQKSKGRAVMAQDRVDLHEKVAYLGKMTFTTIELKPI